jgi:E3 ubiquitin-protein ligase HUWE1
LKGNGWDLVAIASKDVFDLAADPVTISFYPKNVASSSKGETSVTMDLSDIPRNLYPDELAERARASGIPIEAHYSAFVTLRISFMQDREERRQLLAARLLAAATYGEQDDDQADVSLPCSRRRR